MSQLTVDQALQLALQHQYAGQLAEAEELYRQILDAYPDQADALHLLGGLYLQAKRTDLAEVRIRQAILIRPEPAFKVSLGVVLQTMQRFDEAIALYREIIAAKPDLVDAHMHLGVLLSVRSRFEEAAAAFQEVLRLSPGNPTAQGNLGTVLCHLQRFDEAIWVLRSAVTAAPNNPDFHASLGAALFGAGQLEAALAECQQAVSLDAKHGQAYNLISVILRTMGKSEEAIEPAKRAAALMPDIIQAQVNYGESLRLAGKLDQAAGHYQQAIERHRAAADLHNNLANVYKDRGQLDEAIAEYRKAVSIDPSPAWYSNLLYAMHYSPRWDANAIYQELQRYNDLFAKPLESEIRPHPNDRTPDRRLRIGYLSSEFRQHALGLNLMPLFTRHDRAQFEIFCYSGVEKADFYTFRLRQCVDHWQDIRGKSDAEVADMVRRDQIDIFIDLHQHMGGNRLPVYARKPAPVQIGFAGYPGSTGLTTIDFRLTDPYLDPPPTGEIPPHPSSETPIRLPDTFWCFHAAAELPVNDLPALSTGHITFGNLNNFSKFNEGTYSLWAQIMHAVEKSSLMLLAPEGSARECTRAYFKQNGIASDRIRFVNRASATDYYKYYHQIDLGLDSFPCNGHTTGMDSFWMGVPVTSVRGDRLFARATWSQASNLGLQELVGDTGKAFVEISVTLAKDRPRLAELRRTLRERMRHSPLMDDGKFAKGVENAYRFAWRHWCAKRT